jgi:hypothetical protein
MERLARIGAVTGTVGRLGSRETAVADRVVR